MPPLLHLLRAIQTSDSNIRMEEFPRLAIEHAIASGLGPAMYHICPAPHSQNDPLARDVLSASLSARVLVHEHLNALEEILGGPPELSQQVTLLKGISLCHTHYPEPHLRLLGDIDILVPENEIATMESRLRSLGYRQESPYSDTFYQTFHHTKPFFHPKRQVWIEVHRALFPPSASAARNRIFSSEYVAQHSCAHQFRGLPCRRLGDELHFAYICSHWAEEFNPTRGLVPLLDALLLLTRNPSTFRWHSLLEDIGDEAAITPISLVVGYLMHHGLVRVEPGIIATLNARATPLARMTRWALWAMIDRFLATGLPFGNILTESNVANAWKTLLEHAPAINNLARVPWNILFPPGNMLRWNPRFQFRRIKSALGRQPPT